MAVPGLPGGEGPYFFFSYAHTPKHDAREEGDPDVWVGKLFDQICGHIMHLTNVPAGMAGFMDRDLRPGQQWPRKLAEALATAKVFVPLYSPRYFASEDCGKEWFAFSRRMLNHAARVSEVDAIVPALWGPPMPTLPIIAQGIQFEHRALNETYGARGFYQIMKINRFADDYEEATLGLANRIIELARDPRGLSPSVPADYARLENAFQDERWDAPGSKRVRFIIAALSKTELPDQREEGYYGNTQVEWNPYGPESKLSLADHAAGLAKALSYRAEIGDIEEDAEELLSEGAPTDPQVLLIDPWVVRHEPYRELLARFDRLNKPWVQVVVACNRADHELTAARDDLMSALNAALPNRMRSGRIVARQAARGISSLEEFGLFLPEVIHIAARQYLRAAGAYPAGS